MKNGDNKSQGKREVIIPSSNSAFEMVVPKVKQVFKRARAGSFDINPLDNISSTPTPVHKSKNVKDDRSIS